MRSAEILPVAQAELDARPFEFGAKRGNAEPESGHVGIWMSIHPGEPVGEIFRIRKRSLAIVKPLRRIEHGSASFSLLGQRPLRNRGFRIDRALRRFGATTDELGSYDV